MESVVIESAQQAGFTLIELMIVIVLVSIFITVGVPSFQNLVSDNRLSTQANRIVSSLQFARSEALKVGAAVSVCRSTDGATCVNDAAQTWETGWIVFVDDDLDNTVEAADGNGAVDAGENIIQTVNALTSNNTLRAAAPFNGHISYLPTGLQDAAQGNFRLCNGNNPDITQARQISVSTTGRVQTSTGVAACP